MKNAAMRSAETDGTLTFLSETTALVFTAPQPHRASGRADRVLAFGAKEPYRPA